MKFRETEDIENAKQFVGEEDANGNETAVHHNEGFANNKNEKSARIIPSDVEKEVSLQIEREFDDAVKELGELLPSEESEDFGSLLNKKIGEYSKKETKELEEEYGQKISGLLSTLGLDRGETGQAELGDNKKTDGRKNYGTREGGIVEAIRHAGPQEGFSSGVRETAILLAAAERELHYRRHREEALGSRHGLHPGDRLPLARVREIFKATNTDAEVKELFDKAYEIAERLGVESREDHCLREGIRTKKSPNTVAGSSQAISSASAVSGEIAVKLIVLSETYKKN